MAQLNTESGQGRVSQRSNGMAQVMGAAAVVKGDARAQTGFEEGLFNLLPCMGP